MSQFLRTLVCAALFALSQGLYGFEVDDSANQQPQRYFDLHYLIENAPTQKVELRAKIPFGPGTFVFKRGNGAGYLSISMKENRIPDFMKAFQLWKSFSTSQEFNLVEDQKALRDAGFPESVIAVIFTLTPPKDEPDTSVPRAFIATKDHVYLVVSHGNELVLRCPDCEVEDGKLCEFMALGLKPIICKSCATKPATNPSSTWIKYSKFQVKGGENRKPHSGND